ncbi:MAG: nitroreductase family protein [Deltaproteobacteria bacterium]|nr:nitroreductase family protein [Deltaproteobacteria bacterium]
MDRTVYTTVDQELCIGCGRCIAVCPSRTLSLVEGKAAVTGDRSLSCGHCQAVCPTGAVRVTCLDPTAGRFATFTSEEKWLPWGGSDPGELARLMRSRRSCRNYRPDPVPRPLLADLIRLGRAAPSGTNSQRWTFTVLPDRAAVMGLARAVGEFFQDLNHKAEKAWLRTLLKLVGRPELAHYWRDYYQSAREAQAEWEATGRERLFHGAPAAILVGSEPGGSLPAEDALLATQNMLLGAHALGLGTCLVGFVVAALKANPALKKAAGVPAAETVHAVVALGWPDEEYLWVAGRKPAVVRWVGAGK